MEVPSTKKKNDFQSSIQCKIYFQVALGIAYRWYDSIMVSMNKPTKMCWTVNRGEGMSPVQSCEGRSKGRE